MSVGGAGDDSELGDTVDGMPLRLILAVKGHLDACSRAWPDPDEIPAAIRDTLLELNDIWCLEVALAIAERSEDG